MSWREAILRCVVAREGTAHCQDIYKDVGKFISLSPSHLRDTRYGGRPAYQHEVRSYLSNLRRDGALNLVQRGTYKITAFGKASIA